MIHESFMWLFHLRSWSRLGEAQKAIYHYKHAGSEADPEDIAKAKTLLTLLQRCTEARKLRDWNSLIRESGRAISGGADSAPQVRNDYWNWYIRKSFLLLPPFCLGPMFWPLQSCLGDSEKIFALKAEALLKLQRHQEADETLSKGPNFEVDSCTKFLGPTGNANLLTVQARVDMTAGRSVFFLVQVSCKMLLLFFQVAPRFQFSFLLYINWRKQRKYPLDYSLHNRYRERTPIWRRTNFKYETIWFAYRKHESSFLKLWSDLLVHLQIW